MDERLNRIAQTLIDNVKTRCKGSLRFVTRCCPSMNRFNQCGVDNCKCLPHVCLGALDRLKATISVYIEKKLKNSTEDKVYFVTDYKVKSNNPIVICMNRLGYPLDYIKEWVKDCNFDVIVLTNLEFFANVYKSEDECEVRWFPTDPKAKDNEVEFLECMERNLPSMRNIRYSNGW